MHKIYIFCWKLALKISEKSKLKKKTVFICLNTLFWCIAGILIYLLLSIIPLIRFSVINMFVTAGYFGVIAGYFGSAMYIFRNTEPEELE